jgi:hypothetical protein
MKPLLALAALCLAACLSATSDPSNPSASSGQPPVTGPAQTIPEPQTPPPQNTGGSDTETLTGFVSGADGSALPGIPVKLLPASYDPSHPEPALIRRVLTDTAGKFSFAKVDTAMLWNVIAGDSARKSWALAQGLRPGPAAAPLSLSLGKVFLISLHTSAYAIRDSGIAYFPGTDILTRCDAMSVSKVDSVPAGATRFVIESRAGWKYDTTLAVPGDTARVRADRNQFLVAP